MMPFICMFTRHSRGKHCQEIRGVQILTLSQSLALILTCNWNRWAMEGLGMRFMLGRNWYLKNRAERGNVPAPNFLVSGPSRRFSTWTLLRCKFLFYPHKFADHVSESDWTISCQFLEGIVMRILAIFGYLDSIWFTWFRKSTLH